MNTVKEMDETGPKELPKMPSATVSGITSENNLEAKTFALPVDSVESAIAAEAPLPDVEGGFENRKGPETAPIQAKRKRPLSLPGIIGNSERMEKVFDAVHKVADTDSTVLILGESGTGKELFAKAVHRLSPRARRNFVVVNCGAIPEDLLESELFGHEKGSFTGAIRTRIGKFEMAHEGSIFLDEIGDMSPSLQVKLLRILQEQRFERVGGNQVIRTNVRIIAATNKNLKKAIAKNEFREDLYYRLNVIPLDLPPLRDRQSDTRRLAEHFITCFNKTKVRSITGISPGAMDIIAKYDWPGNVRELENVCERMVVMRGEGEIDIDDLPYHLLPQGETNEQLESDMLLVGGHEEDLEIDDEIPAGQVTDIPDSGINLKSVVEEYETLLIIKALEKCGWVKNRAAALLSLNRTTLVEKLKKKGLNR